VSAPAPGSRPSSSRLADGLSSAPKRCRILRPAAPHGPRGCSLTGILLSARALVVSQAPGTRGGTPRGRGSGGRAAAEHGATTRGRATLGQDFLAIRPALSGRRPDEPADLERRKEPEQVDLAETVDGVLFLHVPSLVGARVQRIEWSRRTGMRARRGRRERGCLSSLNTLSGMWPVRGHISGMHHRRVNRRQRAVVAALREHRRGDVVVRDPDVRTLLMSSVPN
jgi:hypothetical protein